jgi:hypothetical protein
MKRRYLLGFFALCAALSFVACSSTLQVAQVNPATGYLPTGSVVKPEEIKVKETLDVAKSTKMLYVKSPEDQKTMNDFIMNSINNLKCFGLVKDKTGIQGLIIEKGIAGKYSGKDVNDLLILNELTNDIGDFLVLDWALTFLGGFDYKFEMKVLNPTDMKLLFHVDRQVTNWAGLDEPLFYPVFNALKNWVEVNKRKAAMEQAEQK